MVRLEAEGAADAAQADEGNGADEDDAAAQAVSQRAKHHLPQHGPRQRGHADAGLRPFELMLRVQGVEDILHQVNDEEDVCVGQEADARHEHLQWAGGQGGSVAACGNPRSNAAASKGSLATQHWQGRWAETHLENSHGGIP